jgi:hypothetical protein
MKQDDMTKTFNSKQGNPLKYGKYSETWWKRQTKYFETYSIKVFWQNWQNDWFTTKTETLAKKKLENWWKLTLGTKRKTDNGLLATLNWTMKTQTILESSSRKSELKWKKLKEKKLKYSETKKISTQKHFTTKIKTQTCKILRKNFKRHRKEKNHFKQDFALFLLYMIFFLIHP